MPIHIWRGSHELAIDAPEEKILQGCCAQRANREVDTHDQVDASCTTPRIVEQIQEPGAHRLPAEYAEQQHALRCVSSCTSSVAAQQHEQSAAYAVIGSSQNSAEPAA